MSLKGQYIGMLFSFLAGLIILAHAVVPHHHHFGSINSPAQEATCENSGQENNTEDPVSYCHAFNILVSERITNSSLNQSFSEYFSFYLAGGNVNIEASTVRDITAQIFGRQVVFIKQFFFTARSLRAPPAIA
ncbi:DUF6769 family protein [Marinilabilia salmonicolor]|uniref:Uncharacterized protein n=1 Tax=Marinilabilia salmonicolor TaxID=989 RepID=A0A368VF72_9BACT|nr:DUF6769 family protein [Marinilabilia salmonicolor]RCW38930.1 hypothetical protein DFO77_10284 [Marinilabilia salmonicolor]